MNKKLTMRIVTQGGEHTVGFASGDDLKECIANAEKQGFKAGECCLRMMGPNEKVEDEATILFTASEIIALGDFLLAMDIEGYSKENAKLQSAWSKIQPAQAMAEYWKAELDGLEEDR